MNQHGHVKIIHQPCANPSCRNMVRLIPSALKAGRRYCSRGCIDYSGLSTYHPLRIKWILEMAGKMSRAKMAERMNITIGALAGVLHRLREKGHKLPDMRKNNGKFKTLKSPHMQTLLTKDGNIDKRPLRSGSGKSDHMKRKPPVEGASINKEDMPIKSRKVTDGPIKFYIGRTLFTARDEEHAEALKVKYAYLDKNLVAGLKLR